MAEVDHAALEANKDELEAIVKLTEKAELELALKRNELMTPIFEKRREVIAKIPKFWPTVLQMSHAVSEMSEPRDVPALDHLTDVWVKYDPKDPRLFDIILTFSENPYFTNKELVKKVRVRPGEDGQDEPFSEDFKINWKEGKDLTNSKRKKDELDSASFFEWFTDDDASLAQYFALEFFAEALSIYVNGGEDNMDDDDDDESVDLEGSEDEEEEEHPKKKSKK
ncbi:hypothetical protein BGX27_004235 [Mortierella sp. AM989]|nr:hypothetical protein BGX27_004235 [Mortierella sp. AM989]